MGYLKEKAIIRKNKIAKILKLSIKKKRSTKIEKRIKLKLNIK